MIKNLLSYQYTPIIALLILCLSVGVCHCKRLRGKLG